SPAESSRCRDVQLLRVCLLRQRTPRHWHRRDLDIVEFAHCNTCLCRDGQPVCARRTPLRRQIIALDTGRRLAVRGRHATKPEVSRTADNLALSLAVMLDPAGAAASGGYPVISRPGGVRRSDLRGSDAVLCACSTPPPHGRERELHRAERAIGSLLS